MVIMIETLSCNLKFDRSQTMLILPAFKRLPGENSSLKMVMSIGGVSAPILFMATNIMKICNSKKENERVGKVPRTPCGLSPTNLVGSHPDLVPPVKLGPTNTTSHCKLQSVMHCDGQ